MHRSVIQFGRILLAGGMVFSATALADTIQVTEPIAGEVRWVRTNEYVLNRFIYVLAGAELHIEAGTVVKGKPGKDADTSALIVTAGGKLFAEGTPTQPVIFTAEADDVSDPDDLGIFDRGLWGGVVLLGKASINTATSAEGNAATPKYEVFEGLPDTELGGQRVNRFGGSDDGDSSGVLRYVSIRHAGVVFQPNKELNGLSLGGVGRGTTLEFVEAYAAADDGFEFFGGTVNTKYLVSAFNDDDAFDVDMGWRGKNQFWFAIQEPGKKDNGGEWNGEPNGAAANNAPVANYELYNATWIGAGTNTAGNRGFTIREYAAPEVYNSVFTEFGGNAVSVDDKSKTHLDSGLLDFRDNLFWNFATNGVPVALNANANAAVLFTDAARNNRNLDPLLRGVSRTSNGGLDPRPAQGSPALTSARTAPQDGFYHPVQWAGAFRTVNWATDWTFLSGKGVLTAQGGGNPLPAPAAVSSAPTVIASVDAAGVKLEFATEAGRTYQVQSRTSLGAGDWANEGAAVAGTGSAVSVTLPTDTAAEFFRVVVE